MKFRVKDFETRTGRRIALVLHMIWIIPTAVVIGAALGVYEMVRYMPADVRETWSK